jgi:hypothetical protein
LNQRTAAKTRGWHNTVTRTPGPAAYDFNDRDDGGDRGLTGGTVAARHNVQPGVDDDEREALRAEGLDPDDPAVAAAIDMARWELSRYLGVRRVGSSTDGGR